MRFLPKQEQFFELFVGAAKNIDAAARLLVEMIDRFDRAETYARDMKALEEKGDDLTHEILVKLHRTFITPIDREDIVAIARGLDDVLDYIEGAADRLVTYAVAEPTPACRQFAAIIAKAGERLVSLMALLRKESFEQLSADTLEINRLENDADRLLRQTVKELFAKGQNPLEVIKWKEIYETLETATDRFEQVCHLVEGIVVKNS